MSNAQILLKGDAVAGAPFIAFAKAKLKALRGLGLDHAQRTFVVGDVEIQIDIRPEGDRIYIKAGGGCPPIQYSGYLDTYSGWFDESKTSGIANNKIREDIEDYTRTRDYVLIEGNPKMYGMRKFPAYNASKDPEPIMPPGYTIKSETYPKVSVERNVADKGVRDDSYQGFLYTHKPSRYSGIMRRVLQCTFATTTWKDVLVTNPGNSFRLNYEFGDSWGVVLAPGSDGSKGSHYFLIWISSEVQYVPADFCVHKKTLNGRTVYAPVLKAVHRTKGVSIGSLAELKGSSQHKAIGWAFSYTEPKASVVTFENRPSGDSFGWWFTSIARLEFLFSGGVPSSIEFTQSEGKCIRRSPFFSGEAVFNGLGTTLSGAVVASTFDFTGLSSPYGFPFTECPLHVFYNTGGEEIISEYSEGSVEANTTTTTPVIGTIWSLNTSIYAYNMALQDWSERYSGGEGDVATANYTWFRSSAGSVLPPKSTGEVVDTRFLWTKSIYVGESSTAAKVRVTTYDVSGYGPFNVLTSGTIPYSIYYRTHGTTTRHASVIRSCVTLFPEDREAVLVAYSGGQNRVTTARAVNKGSYVSDISNSSTPPKDTGPYSIYRIIEEHEYLGASSVVAYIPNGVEMFGLANLGYFDYYPADIPGLNNYDPGTTVAKAIVLCSGGEIDMSVDSSLLNRGLSVWNIFDKLWAPDFSAAAYQPDKFYEYRNWTTGRRIVKMDSEEYNPENTLTAWIGVV